jgi:hypothetical protein
MLISPLKCVRFPVFGTVATNENCINEGIKSWLNLGNAC